MEKLPDMLNDEELVSDLKKVLSKSGLNVDEDKLKDSLKAAGEQMDIENVSGGNVKGIIKGVGILSGAILGGAVSGTVISKATGFYTGKESVAGMAGGAYIGYEVSDTIINFLKNKKIL